MRPRWTQRANGAWAWAGYAIVMRCTPFGVGWQISRDGRPASALIMRDLRGAMRLAEWDAAVQAQAQLRARASR